MEWVPKYLTREQLEERRRAAARWLRAGKLSPAEIGRRLGVSRAAVGQWRQQLQQGGVRALRRRQPRGRPARLSPADQRTLVRQLKRGAVAAGFPTERWTLTRVRQRIDREFGVRYHVHDIPRLLDRLGWSWQQPLPRAAERDEALIRAGLDQDWPRIKKGAALRRQQRVFR